MAAEYHSRVDAAAPALDPAASFGARTRTRAEAKKSTERARRTWAFLFDRFVREAWRTQTRKCVCSRRRITSRVHLAKGSSAAWTESSGDPRATASRHSARI